jgi:ribosome-binding protein aMBF1 (putative translation factor)
VTTELSPKNSSSLRESRKWNVGYDPLAYDHHDRKNGIEMVKRRRQVQPRSGPEKAFGEALRQIRKGRGMSQMDLFMESGIDRTYISAVERGIQSPTIRMIVRFANCLKVKPSELVRRMEQSPRYSA